MTTEKGIVGNLRGGVKMIIESLYILVQNIQCYHSPPALQRHFMMVSPILSPPPTPQTSHKTKAVLILFKIILLSMNLGSASLSLPCWGILAIFWYQVCRGWYICTFWYKFHVCSNFLPPLRGPFWWRIFHDISWSTAITRHRDHKYYVQNCPAISYHRVGVAVYF